MEIRTLTKQIRCYNCNKLITGIEFRIPIIPSYTVESRTYIQSLCKKCMPKYPEVDIEMSEKLKRRKQKIQQTIEYLTKIKGFVPTWEKSQKGNYPRFSNYPKTRAPWFVDGKFVEIRNSLFVDLGKAGHCYDRAWYIRDFTTIEDFLVKIQTLIDEYKIELEDLR